ncbi:HU family DNA-binding protein [Paraburkholderia sp. J7]|uniref:HU family DNA-binding protein n=1 Tax=Paraburkholderia sp. J7 TaxID=2805438 RepID=UPI002AB7E35A|nr:HU family DNA-binding protein [Paraburkholderia sp. J7]
MNRQGLIDTVAAGTGGSKTATSGLGNAVPGIITHALVDGSSVQRVGFGPISVGRRAARSGRNPAAGAEIYISAVRTAKFTAAKALKEAVSAS